MISVTIGRPSDVEVAPWNALAARATPNAFMHPAALKAAQDTGFADVRVLQAWGRVGTERQLVGLWALQVRRILPLWPAVLEGLPYYYAFQSSPMVDPAYANDVMAAFLAAIRADPALPNVISLQECDAEGEAFAALARQVEAGEYVLVRLTEEARPIATREAGRKTGGSTRKRLRQAWNRLSAQGRVEIVEARDPAAIDAAIESFLALEAGSWKGANGTALLSKAADAAFARRLIRDMAGAGAASVVSLQCDGRALAAMVVLYCGTTAYTWKLGFDAAFSRYSPGAVLVDRTADMLLAGRGIAMIDSCSAADSFVGQLWSGRRMMVDALVDVGQGRSFAFMLELARQRGYEQLRQIRNRLLVRQSPAGAVPKDSPAAQVA